MKLSLITLCYQDMTDILASKSPRRLDILRSWRWTSCKTWKCWTNHYQRVSLQRCFPSESYSIRTSRYISTWRQIATYSRTLSSIKTLSWANHMITEDAFIMLASLRNDTHYVATGVTLIDIIDGVLRSMTYARLPKSRDHMRLKRRRKTNQDSCLLSVGGES